MMTSNNNDLGLTHSNVNGSFISEDLRNKAKRENADASHRVGILALMSSDESFLSFEEVSRYGFTRVVNASCLIALGKKGRNFEKCATIPRVYGDTIEKQRIL